MPAQAGLWGSKKAAPAPASQPSAAAALDDEADGDVGAAAESAAVRAARARAAAAAASTAAAGAAEEVGSEDDAGNTAETAAAEAAAAASKTRSQASQRERLLRQQARRAQPRDWRGALLAVAGVLVYGLNWLAGRRENAKWAVAFAERYCAPTNAEGKPTLMAANFAEMGTGDASGLLLKESENEFFFYATGRRNCAWLSATLCTRPRQCLYTRLASLVGLAGKAAGEDRLTLEFAVPPSEMEPVCLVVGRKREAKALRKDDKGLGDHTKALSLVGKGSARGNYSDKLACYAEAKEVLEALIPDGAVERLLSDAALEDMARGGHFVSLAVRDAAENRADGATAVVGFQFRVPTPERMGELDALMDWAIAMIDTLGRFKLSPALREKALRRREKVAAATVDTRTKQEKAHAQAVDAEERRKAKLEAMSPAERAKELAKMKKKQQRKAQMRGAGIRMRKA